MMELLVKAYLQLLRFDFCLLRKDFPLLYNKVRRQQVCGNRRYTIGEICRAINLACIWYRKRVLCLHRSAATVCLLKSFGHPAKMVIGVQHIPFRSHAWVEVDGHVENDRPYMPEIYAVLDRC